MFDLPKCSSDRNPDEKVWNPLKHQELNGYRASTHSERKSLTQRKLNRLSKDRPLIRGLFF